MEQKRLIITTIDPAEGAEPGKVLDCFELAFNDVTEIILCGEEIAFVRADGTIVHSIDDDRLTDTDTCPRCPASARSGDLHTCPNPVFPELAAR